MPIEADYREEEEKFGKNTENDSFGEEMESDKKSPVNNMLSIFGNNAMGVVDGKHASMDELNNAGNFGYDMPPPEAELPQSAMDFGAQDTKGMENERNPEPSANDPGAESPAEGFGKYNTFEK